MKRTRYEYLQHDMPWPKLAGQTVDLPTHWQALEFGENGWDLVSVVRTPTGTLTSLFKRAIIEAEAVTTSTPKKKGKA